MKEMITGVFFHPIQTPTHSPYPLAHPEGVAPRRGQALQPEARTPLMMGPLGLRASMPAPCFSGDRTAAALRAASTVFVGYRTDDRSALVTNGLQHRFAPAVWPLNTRASLRGWRTELAVLAAHK